MDYLSYQDMIAELGGAPVDKEARAKRWASLGITTKEFNWDGENNEAYGTIYFQHSKPLYMAWYEWKISVENFQSSLRKELGAEFELVDYQGGNGHYSAGIKVLS